ncbi:MAG: TIM barrel protein, partial [Candidatus Hydrothermarchaeales archaeon]
HELQWLNPKEKMREAAHEHVLDTIGVAEGLGADYVLTVPSYGFDVAERPREKCIENYKRISEETHLNILIEALSPKQTGFLPSLPEVAGLVKEIDSNNVGLAADTWHIEEASGEVVDTLRQLKGEISELHLRDTDSKPPGRGNMDFKAVLDASSPRLWCLEFDMNTKEDLIGAVRHLRSLGLDV